MDSNREHINVLAVFASFGQNGIERKITPKQFVRSNGELHTVDSINQTFKNQNDTEAYIHFVITTKDQRHFEINFNRTQLKWQLVKEWKELPIQEEATKNSNPILQL